MEQAILNLEHLSKSFDGKKILDDLSIDIGKNEFVTLLGPSGCGKTTTLRMIGGFIMPDEGRVIFEGKDITDPKANINLYRQHIGMVFQHFNLFPHKTILQNMTLAPIQLLKRPKKEAEQEAMQLLDRVGLTEKANAYPSQLSGGQKQRIAIARVFLKDPRILILDEATSALDNESERAIQKSLEELSAGRTTLVIAHRLSTIRGADLIAVVEDGRVAERGTHEQLLALGGTYAHYYEMQFGPVEQGAVL